MKKLSVVLAIVTALALIGCASGGGAKGGGGDAAPYSVDLGTLKQVLVTGNSNAVGEATGETVKNRDPLTKKYDDVLLLFPSPIDASGWSRVTINCKYYNGEGGEINQGDGNVMVSMIRDINGDIRGPEMGAGGNIALKEFNVGGFSGAVSGKRGVRVRNDAPISAILFQSSNDVVKFIEVTEIVFHNGDNE